MITLDSALQALENLTTTMEGVVDAQKRIEALELSVAAHGKLLGGAKSSAEHAHRLALENDERLDKLEEIQLSTEIRNLWLSNRDRFRETQHLSTRIDHLANVVEELKTQLAKAGSLVGGRAK